MMEREEKQGSLAGGIIRGGTLAALYNYGWAGYRNNSVSAFGNMIKGGSRLHNFSNINVPFTGTTSNLGFGKIKPATLYKRMVEVSNTVTGTLFKKSEKIKNALHVDFVDSKIAREAGLNHGIVFNKKNKLSGENKKLIMGFKEGLAKHIGEGGEATVDNLIDNAVKKFGKGKKKINKQGRAKILQSVKDEVLQADILDIKKAQKASDRAAKNLSNVKKDFGKKATKPKNSRRALINPTKPTQLKDIKGNPIKSTKPKVKSVKKKPTVRVKRVPINPTKGAEKKFAEASTKLAKKIAKHQAIDSALDVAAVASAASIPGTGIAGAIVTGTIMAANVIETAWFGATIAMDINDAEIEKEHQRVSSNFTNEANRGVEVIQGINRQSAFRGGGEIQQMITSSNNAERYLDDMFEY